eukprot:4385098-Amphidinium_carterae.1
MCIRDSPTTVRRWCCSVIETRNQTNHNSCSKQADLQGVFLGMDMLPTTRLHNVSVRAWTL